MQNCSKMNQNIELKIKGHKPAYVGNCLYSGMKARLIQFESKAALYCII